MAGSGVGYTIRCWWRRRRTAAAQPEEIYRQEVEAWQQRKEAHQQAGLASLGHVAEWTSASPPTLRTDVFGDSLPGWQGLLITHSTSILAAQPLLLMDLSGQLASADLTAARPDGGARRPVRAAGGPGPVRAVVVPVPSQFADALTEAIHAGAPGGARTDRAVDVRVLEQLTAALDGWITPGRLAAAAIRPQPEHRARAAEPREEALTSGGLFPTGYQQQIGPNLVRLDAFLADLARYTGHSLLPHRLSRLRTTPAWR